MSAMKKITKSSQAIDTPDSEEDPNRPIDPPDWAKTIQPCYTPEGMRMVGRRDEALRMYRNVASRQCTRNKRFTMETCRWRQGCCW
jgi:hypothetical protein